MNRYVNKAKGVKLKDFDKVLNGFRDQDIVRFSEAGLLRKAFFHCLDDEDYMAVDLLNSADTHIRETFCDIVDKSIK